MDGESNYISLQEAAQSCSYSQEYLSLRARQGKLKAIKFGRNWAIKKEWLDEYLGKVEEYNHNHNNHLKTQGFSLPPENLPIEVQNVKYEGVRKYSEFSLRAPFVLALVSVLLISNIVFGKENLENVYPAIKNFSDSVFSSADIYVKGLGENTDEFFSDFSQGLKNVFEQTSSLTASFGGSFDAGAANAIENLARGANGYAYIIADAVAQNADIFLTSLEESFVSVKDDSKEVFLAIKDFPRSVFELSDFYVKEFNDKAIGYLIDSSQSFENVYFDAQSLLSKISGGLSLYASIVIKETDNFLVGVDKFFASVFKNTENISKNISGDINESLVEIKNAGAEIFRMTYGFKNGLAEAGAAAGGVMKEYFSWVEEKVSGAGQNIVKGYKDANELLEDKIGNFGITAKESLESTGRDIGQALREIPRMLTSPFKKEKSEIVVEKVPKEPEKIIEESEPKDSVSEKKETVVKEIIKEVAVEKVTKVEPIKEITKEVQKIDDKSLAQVKASIIELQEEVAKRLYAPGGVISQEIIIKEPVASPKIYQENSDIVLQAVGTGNVILSSGKGMNISGSQVIIDSTSLTNPLVYIADKTTIGGNAIIEGTASIGGAASAHRLTLNAPSDYSGKILDVQYNGTSLFSVTQAGSTALGTTTSGVWQGTVIDPVYGGTGLSSFARGDLLLATTTSAFVRLATGTESQVLTITGGIPAWAAAAGGSGQDTEWIITGSAMYATNTISSLGIGTSSPASLFELYAATTTNTQLTITVATDTTTYDPRIVFRTGSNPTARFAIGVDYSDSNKFKIATSTLGVNDIFTIDQNARIGIGTSSPATTFSIQGTSTTPIFGIFASNSTPIIYTDAGGNIGIGTTTPGAENSKVSIVGSASSDTLFIKGFTTSKWPIYVERSGAASQIFGVYETNLGRGAMAVMDENGNQDVSFTAGATAFINAIGGGSVGIGTTTPSSLLELYAATTTNTQLTITVATDTTTYDPRIVFRTGSNPATKFAIGVDYSDSNKFKIATSTLGVNDIFTIDQNARIGIGTSSPATTFSIQGTSTTPIFGIFASNSTPILYIEPGSGNIGIGTATPGALLDINGATRYRGTLTGNGDSTGNIIDARDFRRSIDTSYVTLNGGTDDLLSGYVTAYGRNYGGAESGAITITTPNAAKTGRLVRFTVGGTADTAYSYFENSLVGIGTTTPASLLEIVSATNTDAQLTITIATSTNTADPKIVFRTGNEVTRFAVGVDYSDSNKFKIATSTLGVNDIFTIDQNARIGIGTSSPATTFSIQGTSTTPIFGIFASNSTPILYIEPGSGNIGIGTTTPASLFSVATTTPIFNITRNGYIGIATSSPARRLEVLDSVNPQMRMTQSGTQYGEFQIDGAGDLTVTLSGNDLLMPDINLQVCIGACPAFTLTGNGNLIVETALYVGSDTTNYIQASSTGMMYGGTAKPKRSVILTSAGAISPTTNGASQTKVDGTNHSYYVLDFDASTDESAFWQWVMPDSYDNGTIDVTTYWEATTTSGVVIWCLQAAGITANNAEDIDASLSTALCQDDTAQANATDLASLATTSIASNFTAGEYVIFKLYRDANDAADTMTADARFVKIKIEYAVTTEGD